MGDWLATGNLRRRTLKLLICIDQRRYAASSKIISHAVLTLSLRAKGLDSLLECLIGSAHVSVLPCEEVSSVKNDLPQRPSNAYQLRISSLIYAALIVFFAVII